MIWPEMILDQNNEGEHGDKKETYYICWENLPDWLMQIQ